jgi:predicted NBD/HSP70 family sugar kinase
MKRKYYIGLDGHSKNCFFVVLDGKGKIVCREKVATAESTILQFVNQFSGEVHLATRRVYPQWGNTRLKNVLTASIIFPIITLSASK